MLALKRKAGQSVLVGRDVTVTVVEITGGNVTLAFDAPRDVLILREELQPKSSHPARQKKEHTP